MQKLKNNIGLLAVLLLGCGLKALAQPVITSPPLTINPICAGDSNGTIRFQLPGDSLNYFFDWNGGNAMTGLAAGLFHQEGLISGTYTVYILDFTTFKDTTVTVNLTAPNPILVSAGQDIRSCVGLQVRLSGTSSTPGLFTWRYTDSLGIARTLTGANINLPIFGPGSLALGTATTIDLTVVTPTGCSASDQVVVTVNPIPIAAFTYSRSAICQGQNVSVQFNGSASTDAVYSWILVGGGGTFLTSGNITATGQGPHTITFHVPGAGVPPQRSVLLRVTEPTNTGAGTCQNNRSNTLIVQPLPVLSVSGLPASICVNGSSQTLTGLPAGGTFTGPGISGTNFNPAAAGVGSHAVWYRYSNSAGCSDSLQTMVRVFAKPSLSLTGLDTAYCQLADPAPISALPIGGTLTGAGVTGSVFNPTLAGIGNRTIRYFFADTNGCADSIKVVVRVKANPAVLVTPDSISICEGTAARFTISSPNAGASLSYAATGVPTVNGYSSGTGSTINQTLTGSGRVIYTINAILQGCRSTDITSRAIVSLRPAIALSATGTQICSGDTASFTVQTLPTTALSDVYVNGVLTHPGLASGNVIDIPFTNPGSVDAAYTVRAVARLNGCIGDSNSILITVKPQPKLLVTMPKTDICQGDTLKAFIAATPNGSNTSWTIESVSGNITGQAVGTGNSFTHVLTSTDSLPGLVVYRFSGISPNGCRPKDSLITVRLQPKPKLRIVDTAMRFCTGSSIILTTINGSLVNWYRDASMVQSGAQSDLSVNQPGNYYVQVTNAFGCTSTSAFYRVMESLKPAMQAITGPTNLCEGATGILTYPDSTNQVQWYRNGSGMSVNGQTLTVIDTGAYSVVVTTTQGCSDTSTSFIISPAAAPFAGTATLVSPTCSLTGTISLSVTGLTANVGVTWTGTGTIPNTFFQNGLSAGTFSYVLRDSITGCRVNGNPLTLLFNDSIQYSLNILSQPNCLGATGRAQVVSVDTIGLTAQWTSNTTNTVVANMLTASNLIIGTYTIALLKGQCTDTATVTLAGNNSLNLSVTTATPVPCLGISGSAILLLDSGRAVADSIVWKTSAGSILAGTTTDTLRNLGPGTYRAVAYRNGCIDSTAFSIAVPDNFILLVTSTASDCGSATGTAGASVTGALAPAVTWYSVQGSTLTQVGTGFSLTSLVSGNYLAVAIEGTCTDSARFQVADSLRYSVTVSQPLACGGSIGSAKINSTRVGLNVVWKDANGIQISDSLRAVNLTVGTYRYFLTQSTCVDSGFITIQAPVGPQLTTTSSPETACDAKDARLTANFDPTATFTWQTFDRGLWVQIGSASVLDSVSSGFYRVIADLGTCVDTLEATLAKPAGCDTTCAIRLVVSSNPVTCQGGSDGQALALVTSGGSGRYQFRINNLGAWTLVDSLYFRFLNLSQGQFIVNVRDGLDTACGTSASQNIGSRIALVVQPTLLPAPCGQSAQLRLQVFGGNAPYNITDSTTGNSFNFPGDTTFNIGSGLQKFSIADANGCVSKPISISVPGGSMRPLRISAIAAKCFGAANGGFRVDTIPASSNLQYKIGNGAYAPLIQGNTYTGLSTGTVTLIIKDPVSGCITDTTITIAQPAKIAITASVPNSPTCGQADGTIRIDTITGGSGFFSYHLTNIIGSVISPTLPYPDSSSVTNLAEGMYGIVVRDSAGCRDSVNITLRSTTVDASVQIIPSSLAICPGQSVTFQSVANVQITSPLYQWFVNSLPIATATADTFTSNTLLPGDTIQVMVFSSTIQACVSGLPAKSQNIVLQAIASGASPTVTLTPPSVVCNGSSVTVRATVTPAVSPVQYFFYKNDTLVRQDTSSRYTYIVGAAPDTLYVIAKFDSSLSCLGRFVDTASAIIINPISNLVAQANVTVADTTICRGSAAVMQVQSNIAGLAGLQYQWYRDGLPIASAIGSSFAAQDTSGRHRYFARLSSSQNPGCITGLPLTTDTIDIYVRPKNDPACSACALRLSVDTVINPTCAGQLDGEIRLKATGGSGTYLFKLSSRPSYSMNRSWLGLGPGSYTYVVRDSLKPGCADTLRNIQLINRITMTASVVGTRPTQCENTNNGTISIASVSGGFGPYLYRIRNIDTMARNSTYTGLAPGNYNITVMDDSTNCLAFVPFRLDANLALVIRGKVLQTPRCYGERTGIIRIDSVLNGRSGYTYSLIGPDTAMNPLMLGQTQISGLAAGNHIVYVRDAAGCVISRQFTITQPDTLRLAAAQERISDCSTPTGIARINRMSGGSGRYVLTIFRPGSALGNTIQIPTDNLLRGLANGDYRISVTDSLGCSAQAGFRIESSGPRANRVLATNACPGGTNGVLAIQGVSGGTSPYTFRITRSDGFERIQTDSVFAQLSPGIYTITVQDSSLPACTIMYTRVLKASDSLKAVAVRYTPSTCDNTDGAAIFKITGGYPGYTYSFDRTLGIPTNYLPFNGDTLTISGLTARIPGQSYSVQLKDNSPDGGCQATFRFIQPGNAPLSYSIQSLDAPCANQNSGALKLLELQGTGPVMVSVFDATTGALVRTDSVRDAFFQNSNWTLDSLNEGTYNVQVQQYGACTSSRSQTFTILGNPQIIAHYRNTYISSPTFAEGEIELDSVTGGVSPYAYQFDEAAPIDFPGAVWFNKLMPGSHVLIIIDSLGCRVKFDLEVKQDSALGLTNVFTPNGDGMNDVWVVKNLPAGSKVQVFNRWGKRVFESDNYKNDWNGGELPQGTYLYSIQQPDGKRLNGWLDLIRLGDRR